MAKEVAQSTGSAYNALCQGTQIKGNVVADRDLRIDGEVEGKDRKSTRLNSSH